ncbi:hypothetical protein WJX73_004602 [Symbiochloris irregularis]|uniref:Phosphodiesterase n=1 Tax=Symbiochloris irregularis TaxID=706552 RepID=A0AAW1PJM2_9CHLO
MAQAAQPTADSPPQPSVQDWDYGQFERMQTSGLAGVRTDPDHIWTLSSLSLLDGLAQPAWVSRRINEHTFLRYAIYMNKACRRRLGAANPPEAVLAAFEKLEPQTQDMIQSNLRSLQTRIVENGQQVLLQTNISQALSSAAVAVPPNITGCMSGQGISVRIGDKVERLVLGTLEREQDPNEVWGSAVSRYTPIHNFLFSAVGRLLYATSRAYDKLTASGMDMSNFTLADLLQSNGEPQTALAQAAIAAIITHRESHHRITLPSLHAEGSTRHTLYEMWPSRDPVDSLCPAIVVSAFDVTHLTETEHELDNAKLALQQNNDALQAQMQRMSDGKADLESERSTLQQQLKAALKLHLLPRGEAIVPMSPLDKIITILDTLLEGRQPTRREVMDMKAMLLRGGSNEDLRQPLNLEEQLQVTAGMTEDANRSLMNLLQDQNHAVTRMARSKLVLQPQEGGSNGRGPEKPSFFKALSRRGSIQLRTWFALPVRLPDAKQALWYPWDSSYHISSEKGRMGMERIESAKLTREASVPPAPPPSSSLPAALCRTLTPHVDRLLQESLSSWDFNMQELDEATGNHALSCYAFFVWQQSGLYECFTMLEDNWIKFLHKLEAGYDQGNPFHNHVHVAASLHMVDRLARQPQGLLASGVAEHLLLGTLYLSTIFHDYGHPGLTNEYLVKSRHPLAILYNDSAPLENHHAAASFQLMYDNGPVLTPKLGVDMKLLARSTVIELVIGTDMKQHFSLMSRLQGAIQDGAYTRARQVQAEGSSDACLLPLSPEHRLLACQAVVKCGDLGHWAMPSHLHQEWTARQQAEYHAQGDKERAAGMEVSPLMDRHKDKGSLASSQVGVFEVVVRPLFMAMTQVAPAAQAMLDRATKNYYWWRMQSNDPCCHPHRRSQS